MRQIITKKNEPKSNPDLPEEIQPLYSQTQNLYRYCNYQYDHTKQILVRNDDLNRVSTAKEDDKETKEVDYVDEYIRQSYYFLIDVALYF